MSVGGIINASIHLLVAAVFAFVGWRFTRRKASDRRPLLAFASWWILYSAQSVVTAVRILRVTTGDLDPGTYEALWTIENTLSVFALWGLGAYVLYLRNGTTRFWPTWAVLVLALTAFYDAVVTLSHVVEVEATPWATEYTFERPLAAWQVFVLVLGYYGTLVALAIQMALLGHQATEREVRFRAYSVLVALTILSVSGLISLGLEPPLGWRPLLSLVRVPAAAIVAIAYEPPRRLRAWLER